MPIVTDALRDRRSVRKYALQPVSMEVIRELLDAAKWAPSAHNAQPWRFIALVETISKRNLAEAMATAWRADMIKAGLSAESREASIKASVDRFTNAPVLLIACLTMGDMVVYEDASLQECERDLAIQSLSAAIQNILLAAIAKNLGTCWYCAPAFCKEAVRKTLGIPEEVEPQALITVGYPSEKPVAPARKPLSTYSYLGRWGKNL
jgi:coenzyme F420-0:L-glutamate ligase/coenzyme F420-1:gamma-L-glutamate ligase